MARIQDLGTRMVDACITLGFICAEEAKWAEAPEVKAAMVQHAIGFLGAARGFLLTCRPAKRQDDRLAAGIAPPLKK